MSCKYTDEEIKKALECCSNDDDGSGCGNCPLGDTYPYCDDVLDGQVIDLINRQQAEIERLSHKCEDCAGCVQCNIDCANIESEAVKEFAERLKGEMLGRYCMYFNYEITNVIIDKLSIEMKEEYK